MVYDIRGRARIVDPVLTNIAMGWEFSPGLIGDQIFPAVRTTKRSGKYYVFGLRAFQTPFQGDLRAPGTEANEIPGITTSSDTFWCDEHALQVPVYDEELEEYQGTPLEPFADATELTTQQVIMGREIAIRDLLYTDSIYRTDHVVTLAGATQFNDPASDPIGVFRTAFRRFHAVMQREPNTAIIPYEVMLELEDHDQFLARLAHTERQILTPELIAAILGVEKVLVPGGAYMPTSNPGTQPVTDPDDLDYVWGKNIWLGWVPPRAGWKVPAFGYEFVQPIAGQVMATDRWYEKKRKTTVVRTARRYDLKIVAKDNDGKSFAGYLIKNAVA